jgi:cell division protein FtsN
MMKKLIILFFIFLMVISCRKKNAEDNAYYQPYRKDSSALIKQKTTNTDSITIRIPDIKPDEFPPVNVEDKYFIVIASFSVEEYALAMKAEFEQLGYKPEIVVIDNDGWNKLAITSSNNFEDATNLLSRIRKGKGRFSDARLVVR